MVTDDIIKLCACDITAHGTQMIEAFIFIRISWCFADRKHGIKLHGNESSVYHGIFGRTGMYINTGNLNDGSACIEIFVLNLAFCIAV